MICQHPVLGLNAPSPPIASSPSPLSYRVDFRDTESNAWRVYARFAFRGEAEACLSELHRRGFDTRLDGGNRPGGR